MNAPCRYARNLLALALLCLPLLFLMSDATASAPAPATQSNPYCDGPPDYNIPPVIAPPECTVDYACVFACCDAYEVEMGAIYLAACQAYAEHLENFREDLEYARFLYDKCIDSGADTAWCLEQQSNMVVEAASTFANAAAALAINVQTDSVAQYAALQACVQQCVDCP